MQSVKIAALAFTLVLSMGVINSLGILGEHPVPTNAIVTEAQLDNQINMTSGSSAAIDNQLLGWSAIMGFFGMIKEFMYGSLAIGPYLLYLGGHPYAVAMLAACIVVVLVLGVYQIMTRYGLGWTNL